jgi:hypothetical protein
MLFNRVTEALEALQRGRLDSALLHTVVLVDRLGKERRQTAGVGKRFISYLDDEKDFLLRVSTAGAIVIQDVGTLQLSYGDKTYTLGEWMYMVFRNPVVHEGELPKIEFTDNITLSCDPSGVAVIPRMFVWGLFLTILTDPFFDGMQISPPPVLSFGGRTISLSEIIGNRTAAIAQLGFTPFVPPVL